LLRFLLAQLYLGSLKNKRSPAAVREALQVLRKESEEQSGDKTKILGSAYENAMNRINSQAGDGPVVANGVLSWITCAKRPLSTSELQHALAVKVGKLKLDEMNFTQIKMMVSVCAGLVTIDEKSSIIRLVHYTAQEYFDRTRTSWFPNAQSDITAICITYLSFDVFETGFCRSDEAFEARLQKNVLYDYAARNWGHHAYATPRAMEPLILGFLENETKASASSQAMIASKRYTGYSQMVPKQVTGAHLAAYFGLKGVMLSLLNNGHYPNSRDSNGLTPLSWAARNGREAVVKLLLATPGVDINSKSTGKYEGGRTALSFAAEKGHEAVVKLLLAAPGVDINSKDSNRRTALSFAAENGHEAVVKLLLAAPSVDTNSKSTGWFSSGQTALSFAAEKGHEAVVKLLLAAPSVDTNSKSTGHDFNSGRTALSFAAEKGHEAVVKLLLAAPGVDINSEDPNGRTALSFAAENGHKAVVKLLLAAPGVDTNSKSTGGLDSGRTALSFAAEKGHEAVVKLLLAVLSVDTNSKSTGGFDSGRTALSFAAENGHEAVAKLLLAAPGVDINSKGSNGWTALSFAAENGHEAVVKLLLDEGADTESKDNNVHTPLSSAFINGHEAVVKLLLDTDSVDPDPDTTVEPYRGRFHRQDGGESIGGLIEWRKPDVNVVSHDRICKRYWMATAERIGYGKCRRRRSGREEAANNSL